jgi:hypothetical protein
MDSSFSVVQKSGVQSEKKNFIPIGFKQRYSYMEKHAKKRM